MRLQHLLALACIARHALAEMITCDASSGRGGCWIQFKHKYGNVSVNQNVSSSSSSSFSSSSSVAMKTTSASHFGRYEMRLMSSGVLQSEHVAGFNFGVKRPPTASACVMVAC